MAFEAVERLLGYRVPAGHVADILINATHPEQAGEVRIAFRRALNGAVAAELRRIADESAAAHPDFSDEGWSILPADLRARADELDPR